MADYSMTLTVHADDEAVFQAAMNSHWGQLKENGVYRDRTSQEIKDKMKADMVVNLKAIFRRHRKQLAIAAELLAVDGQIS